MATPDDTGLGTTPRITIRLRRKPGTRPSTGTMAPIHHPLRVSELFCGIGGFRAALQTNPMFSFVFAYDSVPHCKRIYDANFSIPPMTCIDSSHITLTMVPDFDVMFCGSHALDEQNVPFTLHMIRTKKPKVFCFETIHHVHTSDRYTTSIEPVLKGAGYVLTSATLDMSSITSIPQSKKRVYIIGVSDIHILTHFAFPTQRTSPPLPLTDYLESTADIHDKYYYQEGKGAYEILHKNITKPNILYQFRRYYVRENKSERCPTLTANMGRGGNTVPILRDSHGIRKLTPRECLNFQGFSSSFILPRSIADCHMYTHIGEAPSVPIITRIGESIVHAIATASSPLTAISHT